MIRIDDAKSARTYLQFSGLLLFCSCRADGKIRNGGLLRQQQEAIIIMMTATCDGATEYEWTWGCLERSNWVGLRDLRGFGSLL